MSKKNSVSKPKTAVFPKKPYQKPIILYEGYVSTRAGSPLQQSDDEFDVIDYLLGKK
ncbi:MAG: hypothetical protein AAF490_14915 [Chloroflexota bacterium]